MASLEEMKRQNEMLMGGGGGMMGGMMGGGMFKLRLHFIGYLRTNFDFMNICIIHTVLFIQC
jgi:hypothetical protein